MCHVGGVEDLVVHAHELLHRLLRVDGGRGRHQVEARLARNANTAHQRTSTHVNARQRTSTHATARHRTSPYVTARHRTSPHVTARHRTSPHVTARHRTSTHINAHQRTSTHINAHQHTPQPDARSNRVKLIYYNTAVVFSCTFPVLFSKVTVRSTL